MHYVTNPKEIDGVPVVQDEFQVAKMLEEGSVVCRFEWGNSMHPILRHGEYAVLTPVRNKDEIKCGDAVFCKMPSGYYMTHMVIGISDCGFDGEKWFHIASTQGISYGWTKDVLAIARGMNVFERQEKARFSDRFWKGLLKDTKV